ncbi:SMI1/KNR4 family protein [Streptomyces sp. NPDC001678]|uniref:SMI1/KNR4 family protein n=1 Tax=Streptomyces sp. NPDC001678 TaxID=3364599 RepID=UPI00367B568C
MPAHENAGEDVNWSDAEKAWGITFPRDYKAFMSEYGEGVIDNFLTVFQPLSTAYDPSAYGMRFETENARAIVAESVGLAEECAHSTSSLVAWGVTSGPDILCWQTASGDPDRWPVVVIGRHTKTPVAVYETGMVEFLRRVFLAEFVECPLSGVHLWGVTSPKFLHWKEEKRVWDNGIDPWTGKPDPYAGMEWD